MSGSPRVLLVEDDVRLADMVRRYLESRDFSVDVEGRGDRVVDRTAEASPDIVVLDIGLPGEDGLSVLKRLRPQYAGPIVMLTARDDDVDEVLGLELGADDYLTKPVRPRVLVARLNTLLRRQNASPPVEESIRLSWLSVDPRRRAAEVEGAPIELTSAEFDLLWLLAQRHGQVVSRDALYRSLRGIAYDGIDRSIDLRVSHLRRKVGDDSKKPHRIKSVRGVGYLLVTDL